MHKDVKQYLRNLQRNGFVVKRTRSSHWKVYYNTTYIATVPSTPSDHRSLENTKKRVEKALRDMT